MTTPSHIPYLLLVDDDPDDRDLFMEAFSKQNPDCVVEQANSGRGVLAFLESVDELPAVLLLDYQMPDLNGPEILQHLAANSRYKEMTKIVWSTSQQVKDMEDCKRLGAAHYMVKPVDTIELNNIIRQVTTIFYLASLDKEKSALL